MRIGFVSDIHSNYEAFQKALSLLSGENVDIILCLGDIVGYGADPRPCIDLAKENCKICIAGNHDWAAINQTDISYFNTYARAAALWTRKELRENDISYLRGLPLVRTFNQIYLVHSTPNNPHEWNYIFSINEAIEEFQYFDNQVCFIGHSHIPAIFCSDGSVYRDEVHLSDAKKKYLVNIGSVGQPRDRDIRLSCAIFDEEEKKIEILRESYDVTKAVEKIKNAGLPPFLGDRLLMGV